MLPPMESHMPTISPARPAIRAASAVAAALLLPALLAACAARRPAYVAATNETVFASTEEAHGAAPAHTIYIENRSTVPVLVYSVTLRSCENIKAACDSPTPLSLRLAPGRRAMVRRVEPRDPQKGFTYRYSYGWRAESGQAAALTVMASEGSVEATERLAAIERGEAARRAEVGAHDEWLSTSALAALGPRLAGVRAEPDSFVMRVGEAVTLDRIRLMVVDSSGAPIGRARFRFGYQPGVIQFVRPDSLKAVRPGRVVVELRLPLEVTVGQAATLPGAPVTLVVRP